MRLVPVFLCLASALAAFPSWAAAQDGEADPVADGQLAACASACTGWLLETAGRACGDCVTSVPECHGLESHRPQIMAAVRRASRRLAESCPFSAAAAPSDAPPGGASATVRNRLELECYGPDGEAFEPTGRGWRAECACPEGTHGVEGSLYARPRGERGGDGVTLRVVHCDGPGGTSLSSIEAMIADRLRERVESLESRVDALEDRVDALEAGARPVTAAAAETDGPGRAATLAELDEVTGHLADIDASQSRAIRDHDLRLACIETDAAELHYTDAAGARHTYRCRPNRESTPFGLRLLFAPGVGFTTLSLEDGSLPPLWLAGEIAPTFRIAPHWYFDVGLTLGYAAADQQHAPDAFQTGARAGLIAVIENFWGLGFGIASLIRVQDLNFVRHALLGPYVELTINHAEHGWNFVGGVRAIAGVGFREDNLSDPAFADGAVQLVFGLVHLGDGPGPITRECDTPDCRPTAVGRVRLPD